MYFNNLRYLHIGEDILIERNYYERFKVVFKNYLDHDWRRLICFERPIQNLIFRQHFSAISPTLRVLRLLPFSFPYIIFLLF